MTDDLDRLAGAYGPNFRFHDENLTMLSWCVERMIGTLKRRGARSLLSLGIGHEVVSRSVVAYLADVLSEYTIVEGSVAVIERFTAGIALPQNVKVVHGLFEDYDPDRPLDAVEMGFVLEHVDDPGGLLQRYARLLGPGGILFVTVPNALSLHRRFGRAAGMLDDLYRLSPEDLQLGHKRYFDLSSVTSLVEEAGLRVLRAEGVFLKCLTTSQLEALTLPAEVRRAFFEVGVSYPDMCNAIYLETTP